LLFGLALGAISPSLASADVFGPISLVSASAVSGFAGNQQADYAHDAAISGDGRYVAFDGSYGGRSGVWRRDLQTGAVEAVAAQDSSDPAISAPDADLPSISADGRYVSFTTTARLDPLNDENIGPDVYVRDMGLAAEQPCEAGAAPGSCSYTLASAGDGASIGLTYEPNGSLSSIEFEEKNYGSLAAGRTALSANGREVAFVTTAPSNLAGAATPRLQVAVRDLDSEHTELVSVLDEPATGAPLQGRPVSGREGAETYGAVYTGLGGKPPVFADPQPYAAPAPVGASISADGTTVAWMAVDVAQQSRTLPAEVIHDSYTEPLWRRIADGPGAPIRRITGGSDPANPACAASGETGLPGAPSLSDPCQGPFAASQLGRTAGIWNAGTGDAIPRLSADGYTVALLANAQLVALGEDFGTSEPNSDIYLVDMHPGLSRTQALRPLTELAGADQAQLAENGPVEDLGISPDASHVGFTTKRTEFPLGSPAFVSTPAAQAGMLELFEADLSDDTLTRVTQGFEGGASEHPHEARQTGQDPYQRPGDGALSPSFSDDGSVVAFSSTASNLAFGDGNTPSLGSDRFDGSDAFVVSRVIFNPLPTPQSISPAPAGPAIAPAWQLGVTARARSDGSVSLYATVPGAGRLRVGAQGSVRVRTKRHGRVRSTVARRTVATGSRATSASGGALLTISLKLAPRYRVLAGRPGLPATVTVTFAATHHATLRRRLDVSFLRSAKGKRTNKATHGVKATGKAKRRGGTHR
jgi:hypothetical protein